MDLLTCVVGLGVVVSGAVVSGVVMGGGGTLTVTLTLLCAKPRSLEARQTYVPLSDTAEASTV